MPATHGRAYCGVHWHGASIATTEDQWSTGTILFGAQPAEETGNGARASLLKALAVYRFVKPIRAPDPR